MTGDLPQINRARSGGNPGAKSPASVRRQQTAREVAELLRITRVLEKVCERSWDKLDGAARLAAADARQRLVDFCEKHDTEKRKR
jgi:hypothetical protein